MLRALGIRDFVIVDRLDLEFEPGFTVLTGETGAGKSILIDALALVLGERSDAGLVRQGCARAEISAEFSIDNLPGVAQWLNSNDLADEPGVCLLRRVLESGGRSRAYVNGRPSTLQQVKELGERLVDIHGQHEHQSLVRAASQRDLLDAFAGASALAREVERAWRSWQDLRRQRLEWEKNAARWPPSANSSNGRCRSSPSSRSRPTNGTSCRPTRAPRPCSQPDRNRRVCAGGAIRRRGRSARDGRTPWCRACTRRANTTPG